MWPPLRAAALAGLVVVAGSGCRQAAVVFFDLPPQWAAPDTVRSAIRDSAAARAAREWPAIESARTRDEALEVLPVDALGHVDWVAAQRDSVIRPRWGVRTREPHGGAGWSHDVVYESGTVFPHEVHSEWLLCESCHPDWDRLRQPDDRGGLEHAEECAECHGPVAFPVQSCVRCHPDGDRRGGRRMELLPGDLRMARQGEGGGTYGVTSSRALFPHWVHRARYRCAVCHPAPFAMEAETARVTHAQIQRGEACGLCHDDRVAFGLAACDRCHGETEPSQGDAAPEGASGGIE